MVSGVWCFVIAIVTIVIATILAFCVPVFIPCHLTDDDCVRSETGDTEWDIKRRCSCLRDIEIEEYQRATRSSEVKTNKQWLKAHPSIVSVLAKKYVDDYESLLFDFLCTAVIFNKTHVIGGSECYINLQKCKSGDKKRLHFCLSQMKIRSHSHYWSAGGELHSIRKYSLPDQRRFILFEVAKPFDFNTGIKPVVYPGQKVKDPKYHKVRWVVRGLEKKYDVPKLTHYVGKYSNETQGAGGTSEPGSIAPTAETPAAGPPVPEPSTPGTTRRRRNGQDGNETISSSTSDDSSGPGKSSQSRNGCDKIIASSINTADNYATSDPIIEIGNVLVGFDSHSEIVNVRLKVYQEFLIGEKNVKPHWEDSVCLQILITLIQD